jgi:hypothetical protein
MRTTWKFALEYLIPLSSWFMQDDDRAHGGYKGRISVANPKCTAPWLGVFVSPPQIQGKKQTYFLLRTLCRLFNQKGSSALSCCTEILLISLLVRSDWLASYNGPRPAGTMPDFTIRMISGHCQGSLRHDNLVPYMQETCPGPGRSCSGAEHPVFTGSSSAS